MEGEIPCNFGGCEEPSTWELEYWSPIPSVAYACSGHLADLIPRQGETRVRAVSTAARSASIPPG